MYTIKNKLIKIFLENVENIIFYIIYEYNVKDEYL